jgi:hypothetical protein
MQIAGDIGTPHVHLPKILDLDNRQAAHDCLGGCAAHAELERRAFASSSSGRRSLTRRPFHAMS